MLFWADGHPSRRFGVLRGCPTARRTAPKLNLPSSNLTHACRKGNWKEPHHNKGEDAPGPRRQQHLPNKSRAISSLHRAGRRRTAEGLIDTVPPSHNRKDLPVAVECKWRQPLQPASDLVPIEPQRNNACACDAQPPLRFVQLRPLACMFGRSGLPAASHRGHPLES